MILISNYRVHWHILGLIVAVLCFVTDTNAEQFFDDFTTDTTGEYTVTGDVGTDLVYDGSGQRVQVLTGDNLSMMFSHALPPLDTGGFSIDFLPTQKYQMGGRVFIRLVQDANNYYAVLNTDGYGPGGVSKIVNGQQVEFVGFQNEYTQAVNYTL